MSNLPETVRDCQHYGDNTGRCHFSFGQKKWCQEYGFCPPPINCPLRKENQDAE